MTNIEVAQELKMLVSCIKTNGEDGVYVDETDIPVFEEAISKLLDD